MNFSTPEEVQKGIDYINQMPSPACPNCKSGVRMCKTTPCMGTVEDMERLINAGYAKNLMLDWWVGAGTADKVLKNGRKSKPDNIFEDDLPYLAPAIIGHEGKKSPFSKHGTCNLLVNDLCSIHHMKPTQGKAACCKIEAKMVTFNGEEMEEDERIPILHGWNTQKGKDLIERWKKEVNFTLSEGEEEGFSIPNNPIDLIEAFLKMLEVKVENVRVFQEEREKEKIN